MSDKPTLVRPNRGRDAQLEALYAVTGVLQGLQGRFTDAVDALRGLVVNGVLFTGAVKLDTNGQYHIDFVVPFGYVAVGNNDVSKVTVHNDAPMSSAPTQGIGVHTVGAGKQAGFPLAGRLLTLYGTPGAIVMLGVYDRPQQSVAFAPDAAGTLTANDADAQAGFAGASAVDAHNYGYNGATWDRMRTGGDNADAVAASTLGELLALARNTLFNGTSWDRSRAVGAAADGLGVQAASQPSSTQAASNNTNAATGVTFAAVAGQSHHLTSATAAYSAAPTGASSANVQAPSGTNVFGWLGTSSPTGPPCPPGGMTFPVNTSVVVTLGAGGLGIIGWVIASKLTY